MKTDIKTINARWSGLCGLSPQSKFFVYALAVTMEFVSLAASAEPVQRSAAMPVSVTVIAHAKIQSNYQATQLSISKSDVERGVVDIPAASRFSVTSNSRSGYLLEFDPIGNIFESVQIGGLGNNVQLDADGGSIVRRGSMPSNQSYELSFRFTLRPDAKPGSYPWPLLLSARALP